MQQKMECNVQTGEFVTVDLSAAEVIELDALKAKRPAAYWAELRSDRNRKLAESDFSQLGDASVDAAAWATYRSALRDLPANTADPSDVSWPDIP